MLKEQTKRTYHIDILNIMACFSVVVLHSTGEVFSFGASGTWFAALLMQTLGHFSVPVFFMLSGATLLNYRERYTTRDYFIKRFNKIGIPFIFWTCIYVLWNQFEMKAPPITGLMDVVNIFLNNGATNIFWFFYALIPIYLLIPVLSLVDWQKNRRTLIYLLALCFFFNEILPILSRFAGINITSYADLPFKISYIDYALLGYFLQNTDLTNLQRKIIYAGGVLGFIGMFAGTWLISQPIGKTDDFFMNYHSLFCYLMAVAVFVLVRSLCDNGISAKIEESKTGKSLLKSLSGASFGIYLVHYLVIMKLFEQVEFFHPVALMVTEAITVYLISLGITLLIKRIPLIKRIMP